MDPPSLPPASATPSQPAMEPDYGFLEAYLGIGTGNGARIQDAVTGPTKAEELRGTIVVAVKACVCNTDRLAYDQLDWSVVLEKRFRVGNGDGSHLRDICVGSNGYRQLLRYLDSFAKNCRCPIGQLARKRAPSQQPAQ